MSTLLSEALLRCGVIPGERFSVATIKDRQINAGCFDRVEDARAFLDARSGWNQYFCGNPVRPGTEGKPKAADVIEARVMLFDGDPDGCSSEFCQNSVLSVRDFLAEKGIESHAVDSGRGAQLWIRTSLAPEERNWFGKWLSNKFAAPGLKWDGTFNVDRLMRLPGSTNLKTGRVASFL